MSFASQIGNRNFLSPGGFRFTLAKYPKVAYFAQSANIPGMRLSLVNQDTPYRTIAREGVIDYETFSLRFLVDEDLENYMILHNWMRALGVPDNYNEREQFQQLDINQARGIGDFPFADATLTILDSNYNPKFNVVFRDLNPTYLSTLEFDGSLVDTEYFTASVEFDYLTFQIQDLQGNRVTKLK